MKVKLTWTLATIFCIFVGLTLAMGCSTYEFGTNGPLQEANPQHRDELSLNPLTGAVKVTHQSNDERNIEIEEAQFTRDEQGIRTVMLKNLRTSTNAVANRLANVEQKFATYKGLTMLSDSFWNGLDKTLTNAINAAMPGITKWIDKNPKADQATIDAMVMQLFQKALADQLIAGG